MLPLAAGTHINLWEILFVTYKNPGADVQLTLATSVRGHCTKAFPSDPTYVLLDAIRTTPSAPHPDFMISEAERASLLGNENGTGSFQVT